MAPGARMYIIEERCTLHFFTGIIDFETPRDIVHRLGNIVRSIVSSHLLKVYYMYMSQKTSTKEYWNSAIKHFLFNGKTYHV